MPVIDERQELAKKVDLATKQDILTAGTGITIQNNVISATGAGGSTVTVTPVLSTGTRVAAIEVDGTIYTLFAPTPPSVSVTQIQQSGVELARVTIDNTPYSIYAPEGTVVLSGTSAPTSAQGSNGDLYVQYTVASGVYTVDMTYVKLNSEWVELSAGGGTGNVDDVYVNGTSVLDSNKIAQITSYREVTQAEYDALPASKESDNVLYCIKDKATADTTVAPIIYSEEEREVGCWIDGKPLYQKTLYTASAVDETYIDITSLSVDKLILGQGSAYNPSNVQVPISYAHYTSTYNITFFLSATRLEFRIGTGNSPITDAYITLQYTKTTDTPGSGKWTTSGVPAVHYSTDEHVVGTWIDGSPIYEKTIVSDDSLPYRTWTTIFSETGANIHKWEGKLYINSTKTQSVHLDYHRGQGITGESCCTMESNGAIRVTQSVINGTTYGYELTVRYTKTSS